MSNDITTFDKIVINMRELLVEMAILCQGNGAVEKKDGFIFYNAGSLFPIMNGVFVDTAKPEESLQILAQAKEYFSDKKVPFTFWWTQEDEVPDDLSAELQRLGYASAGDFEGIALSFDKMKRPEDNEDINIRKVESQKDYEIFINVLAEVFQLSDEMKQSLYDGLNSYDKDSRTC